MLKIKNEVNLKELEKFGLEFKSDFYKERECYVFYVDDSCGNPFVRLSVNVHTRIIRVSANSKVIDILYELISANLVEKVDE